MKGKLFLITCAVFLAAQILYSQTCGLDDVNEPGVWGWTATAISRELNDPCSQSYGTSNVDLWFSGNAIIYIIAYVNPYSTGIAKGYAHMYFNFFDNPGTHLLMTDFLVRNINEGEGYQYPSYPTTYTSLGVTINNFYIYAETSKLVSGDSNPYAMACVAVQW